ncbi:MAG: hypothetical protein ACRC2T_16870 [Thermoguttaceae bacterium]
MLINEIISNPATQWVLGIAGTAILIAIAYYVVSKIRNDISAELPTNEDHLVEFDRMQRNGHLKRDEFKEVKKNLGKEIAERTKFSQNDKTYEK